MVWNTTLPLVSTKFRLIPGMVTDNWAAIQAGGVPYTWLQLAQQAGAPPQIATTGQLYSKSSGGRTECFYEKDNGAIAQLTGLPITSGAINGGTKWGLTTPWGLILNWGTGALAGGTLTITWAVPFTTFHTCVASKGFNGQDSININWYGESAAGISFKGDGTHTFGFVAIGV